MDGVTLEAADRIDDVDIRVCEAQKRQCLNSVNASTTSAVNAVNPVNTVNTVQNPPPPPPGGDQVPPTCGRQARLRTTVEH